MGNQPKELRNKAAAELRDSRRSAGSQSGKQQNVKRAAAYKALAENQQWLDGQSTRAGNGSLLEQHANTDASVAAEYRAQE
jgi:hypothetical protein